MDKVGLLSFLGHPVHGLDSQRMQCKRTSVHAENDVAVYHGNDCLIVVMVVWQTREL